MANKKMIKRFIALAMSLMLTAAPLGCGQSAENDSTGENQEVNTSIDDELDGADADDSDGENDSDTEESDTEDSADKNDTSESDNKADKGEPEDDGYHPDIVYEKSYEYDKVYDVPGAAMKDEERADIVYLAAGENVEFSEQGGIYFDEFSLSLSAPDGYEILYTLDGSNPLYSTTAMTYEAPIEIKDNRGQANIVSAVSPDLFCANYNNYDKKNGLDCYIKAPDTESVDKCMQVTAVAVKDGAASEVVTNTYFIGTTASHIKGIKESCEAAGHELAVINITMNYYDLFDSKDGIYVKGNIFSGSSKKEMMTNPKFDAETTRKLPANYNQRGREWERNAHIDFFEADAAGMELVMSQNCGVRIQGNYSRSDLQKSFRLYAREEYGKKKFKYPIWGDEAVDINGKTLDSFKTFVLRAGGNCAFTSKYNDTFWQDLASEVDCDTKASRPCVVYLNGEYWGLYVLEEDYSDNYYEQHYDVDKDNVVIYKGDAETYATGYKMDSGYLPEGVTDDNYYINELYEFFNTHKDLKSKEDYDAFAEIVDVQSVMDYFAVEVWINNKWDWPGKNWSMWKVTEESVKPSVTETAEASNDKKTDKDDGSKSSSEYADGKWRFSLYDIEFGGVSGKSDAKTNTVKEDNYKPNGLLDFDTKNPAVLCFAYLMTNDEFNKAYCDRLNELTNTCFDKQYAMGVLDSYEAEYGPLYNQFFERYEGTGSKNDALNGGYASSKCIRDFLSEREDNIDKIIEYCK